jgi:chemotaxis signal transduction protein
MDSQKDTVGEMWHILTERGLTLAGIVRHTDRLKDENRVLFRLGDTCYYMPSAQVRAIKPLGPYEPLPFIQPCIVGLIALDNQSVVVIDGRLLVTDQRTPPSTTLPLLIIELAGKQIGLLADDVLYTPDHLDSAREHTAAPHLV